MTKIRHIVDKEEWDAAGGYENPDNEYLVGIGFVRLKEGAPEKRKGLPEREQLASVARDMQRLEELRKMIEEAEKEIPKLEKSIEAKLAYILSFSL